MKKSSSYGNLYYLQCYNKVVILILYVDDFFFIGDIDHEIIVWLKQELHNKFRMISFELCTKYLNIQFTHHQDGLLLHQTKYVQNIIDEFGMTDCNPFKTLLPENIKLQKDMKYPPMDTHMYQHMVGKLVFLTNTH